MLAVTASGCICCHLSIHKQNHCSPLNDMPHYGMPEVLTRLANPGRCLDVGWEEVPFLSFKAEAREGRDYSTNPMFVWHSRWSHNPGCCRLPSPASEPASNPSPPNTRAHAGHRHQLPTSAVSQTWSCVYKCRHTFMHTQMVQVRIAQAQRNASVSRAANQNHKSEGKHRYWRFSQFCA